MNISRVIEIDQATLPREPILAVGIDLGTTYSVVVEARWSPDTPDEIGMRCVEVDQPTREGRYTHTIVPSVVALQNGEEFVGEGAKRIVARAPGCGELRNRDFFVETKNEIGTDRRYRNAPQGYQSPTEIAARILMYLKASVDGQPARTVVTVPASFQAAQRRETRRACETAAIEIADGNLLDEPVAAFLDYLASADEPERVAVGRPVRLLVLDFGGGTCDVAILGLERAEARAAFDVSPLSISRYHRLGGGDIDAAIVYDVLVPQLMEQNELGPGGLTYDEKKNYVEPALREVAESLKRGFCREFDRRAALSDDGHVDVESIDRSLPGIHRVPLKDRQLQLASPRLDGRSFGEILERFLDVDVIVPSNDEYRRSGSIFSPIEDALRRGNLQSTDIDLVLLAGGSCGLPGLKDAVEEYFSEAAVLVFPDADARKLAIARGAALQALSLALTGNGIVRPVCHDDIAIRTTEGTIVLVPRGAPLPYPASSESMQRDDLAVPATSECDPVELRVEVVAGPLGDERVLFSQPWSLTAPVTRGEALCLEYRYDANQVLELRLRKKEPGRAPEYRSVVENPLSNVVNPIAQEIEAERLERRLNSRELTEDERIEAALELVEILRDLGQREKALHVLQFLQGRRDVDLSQVLNLMALVYDEMKLADRAERLYREAAAADSDETAPLFNLALLLRRQRRLNEAVGAADQAIARDANGPTFVLRAYIARDQGDQPTTDEYLARAFKAFPALRGMSEWELGWYASACSTQGDEKRRRAADAERKRRGSAGQSKQSGELPLKLKRTLQ